MYYIYLDNILIYILSKYYNYIKLYKMFLKIIKKIQFNKLDFIFKLLKKLL